MSDTNLTKKEQQELRGAEARLNRVQKLEQQLREARELASKNTVTKIQDINSQVDKLDERAAKVDEQITAAQQRKQALVDRRDELVKAKYVLADEIEEFLSQELREELRLDTVENVSNNTQLTTEQAEAIAEEAEAAEAEDNGNAEDEVKDEDEGETTVQPEDEVKAKPKRGRAPKAQ
jgi:uncharacterized protein YdcH (DUF465 family)